MKQFPTLLLLLFILFACSKDDNNTTPPVVNGFTLNDKFYPTPFGVYSNTGGDSDYTFTFIDQPIVKGADGKYQIDLKNKTINATIFSELTLRAKDQWVDDFFSDPTETLPGGIDYIEYDANQLMDAISDPINPPDFAPAKSATFKIISKDGNKFEIEYDVVFKNDAHVVGHFKGVLKSDS